MRTVRTGVAVATMALASACAGGNGQVVADAPALDAGARIERALTFIPDTGELPADASLPIYSLQVDFVDNLRTDPMWNAGEQGSTPDSEWLVDRVNQLRSEGANPQLPVVVSEAFELDTLLMTGPLRDHVGYDLDDAEFVAATTAVASELAVTVSVGQFDRQAIESAIDANAWGGDSEDLRGGRLWDGGIEIDLDEANAPGRDSLGRLGQLFVADAQQTVLRSRGAGVAEALALDRSSSLAGDEALVDALTALHAQKAISAALWAQPVTADRITSTLSQIGDGTDTLSTDDIAAFVTRVPELPDFDRLVEAQGVRESASAPPATLFAATFSDASTALDAANRVDGFLDQAHEQSTIGAASGIAVESSGLHLIVTVEGQEFFGPYLVALSLFQNP